MRPSQSSSTPLHVSGEGSPGVHVFCSTPATQDVAPAAWQAPTPHVVLVEIYPSSATPSQLSSRPSQVASEAAGDPGVHVFCSTPATQEIAPAAWQAPTPHVVSADWKSSSAVPSQSSSIPLQ